MSVIFWIAIGVIFLLVLGGSKGNSSGKSSRSQPTRIDRPLYYDPDDHECSVCGARFTGKSVMICPRCGTRFTGTKEDDGEFIEEMELWEEDDD